MPESTMTSKGQTTVPAEVRAALRAEPGTRLAWHVMPDGDVIVRAKTLSILDLAGSVNVGEHVGIKDMNPWKGRWRS
ncbi:type II toxin-antitoxin system PrlF family antitoxin [Paraburkholderia sprentiae WSM5005]|uniref:Type II toxin-antitoxin system PrlF family antitoxin n=1 Tax=Paraburkholderia sprentiae WSM5005 TaxID=754502 RepID=A0A1I9YKI5_9BURK|nr:type II toxin-antitoxin system PrlF family antitoxin [Paraburkholderia sprentiae]APA86818.1 type II toxin-antitoxin system PrlF family antitoxin [Paraburkholderia sprentiae WSM5005]